MAHELENVGVLDFNGLASGTAQAWHNLGVNLPRPDMSAVDAGEHFGMFWPVTQNALWAETTESEQARIALEDAFAAGAPSDQLHSLFLRYQKLQLAVESHVANVRTKDLAGQPIRHLLGVVGADYQVCQNRELAEFTDALAQTGQVTIETVGSIRGGKRVWFLARGESFKIGGTDEMIPYVLVSNGHDGTQAIRVTPTTVRVVCSNTLHMVIPNAEDFRMRPDTAAITIRHSGKIADKLEQARNAISYYGSILARNKELFEAMNTTKMAREEALGVFATTYASYWEVATADDLASTDSKERTKAQARVERMDKARELFLQRYADEQSKLGIGGSQWAYFNALTGYLQHDVLARGKDDTDRVAKRMESNLFGLNATRTHDALASVLAA